MARRFNEQKLVIASHNQGKVREIAELLAPYQTEVVSATELDLAEPDETGSTFAANAELKARASAQAAGLAALADDSGLCVNALGGDPGLFSARWAGPAKDFSMAMAEVHRKLRDYEDKSAYFISVLALVWPDGHCETFEGRITGTITDPAHGHNGFGYDPIFVPDGHSLTFGEFEPAAKNAITHRAVAFQKLVNSCFE
ncbi:MAG: RdgB/HAM1 family non-canonical purine NTP pyrophosphatase [Rhodospirillales bacterium]|nr:RdgB/HAM1 family non-canonical purine NTP pyrophosphatase [Rhodospirillales bacterium]